MKRGLNITWLALSMCWAMLCPIAPASEAQAQSAQPNWIAGTFTVAAGPNNITTNLPPAAYLYYIAWVSDRVGGAGFMVSNGSAWVSDQGPAGLGSVTPSTPSRALNTTFTPSATNAVMACYSVNISVTNPLLAGSSSATVNLVSDTAATPTTIRAVATSASSVGVTVTVQITQQQTTSLCYIVPAGHNVRINSSTTGTASVSIVGQVEEVLG